MHRDVAEAACRPASGRRRRWRRSGSRGRRRCPSWRSPARGFRPRTGRCCAGPTLRRILRICVDQRVDPVADAALAELAEAREVAADLGRVDVRVLGELLRGDRLLAHLAGLDQDLQVARQPRRDSEREAVAVRQGQRPAPCSVHRRLLGHRDSSRAGGRSSPDSIEQLARSQRGRARARTRSPVDLHHRDPLEIARSAGRRRARCSTSLSSNGGSSERSASDRVARLVAEVAAGPRVERRSTAHARASQPRYSGYGAGSRKRAAEAIIAALSVQSSRATSLRRSPRSLDRARRPAPAAARSRRPRRRARRRASRPPRRARSSLAVSWPTTAAW